MPCNHTADAASAPPSRPRARLGALVLGAFAVQIAIWAVWFFIARRNPVQEIPLATAPAHQPGHH